VYIPGLATIPLLMYLACFTAYHLVFSACNLKRNATAIEKWNGRIAKRYDHGCLANYEEVCGARRWILCWPFPCITCFKPMGDGFYGSLAQGDLLPSITEIESDTLKADT
jgi:hypothetical protein